MHDRTLILLRHAKAEPSAHSDQARALSTKGHKQASALGDILRDAIGTVDLALISAARRAQETADGLTATMEVLRHQVESSIYNCSYEDLLDLVRQTPQDVRTLLVVGHEPTMSQTARLLHDAPDDPLGLEVRLGIPTAMACVLDAPAWSQVEAGACHLRALLRP